MSERPRPPEGFSGAVGDLRYRAKIEPETIDFGESAVLTIELRGVPFPCVAKPLAMSASRGVIRADGEADLQAACARIERIVEHVRDSFERRHLLVEAFVPGAEFAVEGLVVQ